MLGILPSVVLILDKNVDIIGESILLSAIWEVDAALQVRSDTMSMDVSHSVWFNVD